MNTSITSHIYPFYLARTFNFYSQQISSIQYSVINYSPVLYIISQTWFILELKVCTLLSTSPYFPHLPAPGNHFFYPLFLWVGLFFLSNFIYSLAVRGPCGCSGFSLAVASGGYSSVGGAWASRCCGVQALGRMGFSSCGFWALEPRLDGCGAWAYLLCGMWDLP